ncbi:adaptor protein MecA [Siminovitchia fortis]|uniref:adaptor protein MecA n=1 Tax=Siminovitchia fortis TaxID=254758 RepID=UPI0011A252F9|nr:adaptor protein MecA [Siminovitchia fortis]
MKLERISSNKIKYSITFEELTKKGFLQDELLRDSFVWDVLFDEMLDEASRIYELNDFGAVSIEIFSLTSRELVLILTLEEEEPWQNSPSPAKDELPKSKSSLGLLYRFEEFDDIILFVKRVASLNKSCDSSSLFAFGDSYYLKIDGVCGLSETIESLCSEYGEKAGLSEAYLEDYGVKIIDKEAFPLIRSHF